MYYFAKIKMYDKTTDKLTTAILATVIFAAKKLLQNRASLFPHNVATFLDNYSQGRKDEKLQTCMGLGAGTVQFSAQWLINQLTTHLQPYTSYMSVVNKLGKLLYPTMVHVICCKVYL